MPGTMTDQERRAEPTGPSGPRAQGSGSNERPAGGPTPRSPQTQAAFLGEAPRHGYLALLSVVHHYLGLDSAPYPGLGEPLKLASEFHDDLNSQYPAWLG